MANIIKFFCSTYVKILLLIKKMFCVIDGSCTLHQNEGIKEFVCFDSTCDLQVS